MSVRHPQSPIIQGDSLTEVIRERVKEVLTTKSVSTSEMTEFYLVSLLNDFHSTEKMANREISPLSEEPLALFIMQTADGKEQRRMRRLREIGDGSLVMVGFFSERIRRGALDTTYVSWMGGTAYRSLAAALGRNSLLTETYEELSEKFSDVAAALSLIAPWNRPNSYGELLKLYERCQQTGDQGLRALLEEQGLPMSSALPGKAKAP